jgi:hypothetical protein
LFFRVARHQDPIPRPSLGLENSQIDCGESKGFRDYTNLPKSRRLRAPQADDGRRLKITGLKARLSYQSFGSYDHEVLRDLLQTFTRADERRFFAHLIENEKPVYKGDDPEYRYTPKTATGFY